MKIKQADNSWANFPLPISIGNFSGASSSAKGAAGTVPAPAIGDQTKFLRGDGQWATPTTGGITVDTAISSNSTNPVQNKAIKAELDKLNTTKVGGQSWICSIKCATWSRLCYIPFETLTIGSSFILNVAGTRGNVVYNETFAINVNHSQKATIAKIGTANYSSIQLRIISDSSGNCYVELYDAANSATNATTQSVYCRLIAFRTGAITTYTTFTDGSTLPTNFISSASITTNGNSLQGNLTWGEITGKPSSYTPATHTHNYAGSSSAGGAATNANNVAINKTNPTTATTYYVPFAANNTGTLPIRGNDGFRYHTLEGTTSAVGQAQLGLGNNTASGTAGNKTGKLYMYGTGTGYTTLTTANTSANSYTATLPAKNGTIAMTSDIPTIPTSLPANGGTAASANKLNTNAGSATQPVYFTNGVPTACTYTLGASVPSGAKFTDTNTWRGIQNNLTSDSTTDSLSAAQGKALKTLVDGKAASNHTHSYLPLSGGTLTGSIVGKTTGGSWISGMTVSNLSLYCSQMNKDSYWPFIGGKTYSSNVWNLGGLGDDFGFYIFKNGRTENGTDYKVTINTTNGVLSSSGGFSGSLSGNASSATKATQDSAGQQINTTYIKGLSISGKTITYTKGDETTGTLTTQDTNTTYGAASSSALGLVKIGSNITNSSGTISITKDNVTAALGYTPPTTNTTYSNMTAATASAAGKAGLVPAPAAGKQTSFLRGDGTWQDVNIERAKTKMVTY